MKSLLITALIISASSAFASSDKVKLCNKLSAASKIAEIESKSIKSSRDTISGKMATVILEGIEKNLQEAGELTKNQALDELMDQVKAEITIAELASRISSKTFSSDLEGMLVDIKHIQKKSGCSIR